MTAAADRLRTLAAEATPGPWEAGTKWRTIQGEKRQEIRAEGREVGHSWFSEAAARLIALAPELAILCADMADALDTLLITREEWGKGRPGAHDDFWNTVSTLPALLARLDTLTAAAGPM